VRTAPDENGWNRGRHVGLGRRASALFGISLLHAALIAALFAYDGRTQHRVKPPIVTFLRLITEQPAVSTPTVAFPVPEFVPPADTGKRNPRHLPAHIRIVPDRPPQEKPIYDPCAPVPGIAPSATPKPECAPPTNPKPPLILPHGFQMDESGHVLHDDAFAAPETPEDVAETARVAVRRDLDLRAAFGPQIRLAPPPNIDRIPPIPTEQWQKIEKWNEEFLTR
jgi:hypothetical protein